MPKSDQTINNHKMELLDKNHGLQPDIITYRFTINDEKMPKVPNFYSRLHQIFPTVCASFSCLPFGLMLGWPSPTNPILLDQSSPIPITIDQSAMIAGFLMIGNAVGTPISRKNFLGSKFGILMGLFVMAIGWILMWQSNNIFWLLGSRFLVGLGNGYGTGQLKIYIGNICDEDLKLKLTKLINMYVYLGIIIIFSFGPFTDFRNTSKTCLLISVVIFFVLLFLPTTPTELVEADKINDAKKAIARLKPNVDVNNEIYKISEINKNKVEDCSLLRLLRQPILRVNFFIFTVLVFCQQFSGAPSTIIYTQILFKESHCPYPEYLAIIYVIIFFFCNILGTFITPKFNKRTVLLCSTISVICLIIAEILLLYFEVNDKYWSYSSFVIMCLFIIAHTLGLGNIPFTMIPDLFPSSYRTSVMHFFIAFHSILALIITKIFQVLMTQYNLTVPFYLFLIVSNIALLFIYFATPRPYQNTNVSVVSVKENFEIKNKTIY